MQVFVGFLLFIDVYAICFCACWYSVGDCPACDLKYLRKVNCSGKPSSSATCLTKISGWRKRYLAWSVCVRRLFRMYATQTHGDGRRGIGYKDVLANVRKRFVGK